MEASQIAQQPTPVLKQFLLFLYGYQTVEEQANRMTDNLNGVGFNMVDAEILSSYAQQVIDGRELSEKQYTQMKLRLPKYHRQLSTGAWEKIIIPTVKYTNGTNGKKDYSQVKVVFEGSSAQHEFAQKDYPQVTAVPKTNGLLYFDEKGCLAFKPNVYPSKQIKALGFSSWVDGAWHQARPKLVHTIVGDIEKLFGEITVTPDVVEALKPKEPDPLPVWVSDLYPTLKDFQKEAIQFTSSHDRLLLALSPRLGKTVVTVISANVLKAKRILVVAPLSLLRDWKNKILKWSPMDNSSDVAILYKKNLPVPAKWTVTNYDTLRLHPDTFNNTPWDLIIVDETLLIKNRNAKRTQWIYELVNKKMAASKIRQLKKVDSNADTKSVFDNGKEKPAHLWFLSGAPTSKMYTDLWSQLNILAPDEFSSYWRFAERYCIVQSNEWTKYNLMGNKPDASDLIKKDLSHIFYTRSHSDVTDMPPLEPEDLGVPMGSSQEKLYAQMEYEFLAELSEDDTLLAPNILAQMLRLVQIASNPLLIGARDDSPKWDALVEMLEFEPRPSIVWTSFVKTVEELPLKFGAKQWRVAKLTGATKQEDRGQIVEDFQQGRVDILIAHPAVGKFGLDLFNGQSVIYLERGYNADDYYQSLMRVRHLDQKVAPHIVHLMSERKDGSETIDHTVGKILASRTDATKKLTTAGLKKMMGVI